MCGRGLRVGAARVIAPQTMADTGVAMTKDQEIRAIKTLIVKAESDSHTWQVGEDAERYMEAYDRTEALEDQLSRRMQQGRMSQVIPHASKPRGKLHALGQLADANFTAIDGPIGGFKGVLFEDKSWVIRYLVIKSGTSLFERDVFISPDALKQLPEHYASGSNIDVALAREECSAAPPANLNLRSSAEVSGYDIQASDLSIGHVEDFLFDDVAWVIRSLVVNTRNWWPGGERVLLATYWIDRIDGDNGAVHTKLTREQVADSPAYPQALLLAPFRTPDKTRDG